MRRSILGIAVGRAEGRTDLARSNSSSSSSHVTAVEARFSMMIAAATSIAERAEVGAVEEEEEEADAVRGRTESPSPLMTLMPRWRITTTRASRRKDGMHFDDEFCTAFNN
jgi:hypothetical protein